MFIGVAGALPARPADITSDGADRLRTLGFQGASVTLGAPGEATPEELRQARSTLTAAGLVIAQANGAYDSLVAPIAAERQRGINGLIDHMRAAVELGAHTCYVRPGGLNPAGPWSPHPDHHLGTTFDRALDSLRATASAAGDLGVTLAFEGHVLSAIDRPGRVEAILDAIESPALSFNLDPVNFIGTIWDAWRPDSLFNHLLDVSHGRIVATHWKDYTVRDDLVLHIDEVTPGDGLVDHATWLRRLNEVQPGAWVLLEHLPFDQLTSAKAALDDAMARAELKWDSPP